jgi:hypothetical protein
MALTDTCALEDPVVRGLDHLFQHEIIEDAGRNIGTQRRDFCTMNRFQCGAPGKKLFSPMV